MLVSSVNLQVYFKPAPEINKKDSIDKMHTKYKMDGINDDIL